jgi:hypothetical protein
MIMARRVLSLDAFRGLAVALMIVVDSIGVLGVAPTQLRHAEWHGLTVADVVSPSSWSRSGRLAVFGEGGINGPRTPYHATSRGPWIEVARAASATPEVS